MKKESAKKLQLEKIKIASLSKAKMTVLKGGGTFDSICHCSGGCPTNHMCPSEPC